MATLAAVAAATAAYSVTPTDEKSKSSLKAKAPQCGVAQPHCLESWLLD